MKPTVVLVVLVLAAFIVRLYHVSNPIADWHSFRQADTASVTREYLKHGVDFLHPTYHDLSNIQSGHDNPQGYRMVEFPLLNGFSATLISLTHQQNNQVLFERFIAIVFSLVGLVSIYGLGSQLSGKRVGLFAAALFAFMPYSVYYSRTILPDGPFLAAITFSLWMFALYAEKKSWAAYLLSLIGFIAASLFKPYAVFFYPLFPAIMLYKQGLRGFKDWRLYIWPILSIIPLYLWRHWILQFPSGIAASDWLLNKGNIRYSGAFFHWIFEVRISTLILGIGMVVPFVLGLVKRGKDQLIYLLWGICTLAYLWIFAGGNVQHDYYQIVILPFLFLVTARGLSSFFELPPKFMGKWVATLLIAVLFVFSFSVSWFYIRGYFNINHPEIVEAGKEVDKILPANAKVIAPYEGDTSFLFATNRTGWPLGVFIDKYIADGAQYYVSVNFDDEANALMRKYVVMEKTKDFVIIDLQRPIAPTPKTAAQSQK
ncbi:MAG TPA: glycosyltransferase family 39 protein [Candidatus Saccharimonadia bacterium]|nr:glycosyltransferase family 39 protein [Candidatus Saccharimonadia bacterium]